MAQIVYTFKMDDGTRWKIKPHKSGKLYARSVKWPGITLEIKNLDNALEEIKEYTKKLNWESKDYDET